MNFEALDGVWDNFVVSFSATEVILNIPTLAFA